jgi:IS605 OrfB family transposase
MQVIRGYKTALKLNKVQITACKKHCGAARKAYSRSLSRKQKGSKNRAKARLKLARQHYKIANIRQEALHKVTTAIVAKTKPDRERPEVLALEDLNVAGMLKNRKLSRAIADVGFGEFRRQIGYKTLWNGIKLFFAARFYPSSKTCSDCGLELDRDLNAALNLKYQAQAWLKEPKSTAS